MLRCRVCGLKEQLSISGHLAVMQEQIDNPKGGSPREGNDMDADHLEGIIVTIPQKDNDYATNMFKMDKFMKVVSYNCRGFPKTPAKLH